MRTNTWPDEEPEALEPDDNVTSPLEPDVEEPLDTNTGPDVADSDADADADAP